MRAAFLRTAADLLAEAQEHVIEAADAETALGPARLTGELARTAAQLRAFAEVVEEGAYLDIHIDHEDGSRTPPWPDLRRYKIPLGVVAVYAASNFPSRSPSPAATPRARWPRAARSSSRRTPTTPRPPSSVPRSCAGPPPGTGSPRTS